MIPTDPRVVSHEYEVYVTRIMNENRLRRQSQQAKQADERWYSRALNWLRCELGLWRIALAKQLFQHDFARGLARFGLIGSLLDLDRTFLSAEGGCTQTP